MGSLVSRVFMHMMRPHLDTRNRVPYSGGFIFVERGWTRRSKRRITTNGIGEIGEHR